MGITLSNLIINFGIIVISINLCRIASELRSIAHYLEQLDWKHSKEYKS